MNPMILLLSSTNKMKFHNLAFLMIIFSLNINLLLFFHTKNKWFPLILTLLFSGGIMILFSFVVSISPSLKYPKNKIPLILFMIFSTHLIYNHKSHLFMDHSMVYQTYSKNSSSLLIITSVIILIAMSMKINSIKLNSPLKSTI